MNARNRRSVWCNRVALLTVAFWCAVAGLSTQAYAEEPITDVLNARKTVLVHYMPWYESKPVSGQWGWHWTMNRFNPDRIGATGRRELASHYRPLIGPYDSNDPNALECQVLLMKFAGIDGVIVDWYGTKNFRDYDVIHRNTQHLVKYIKKAGLHFAICYEDQTVKHMVASGALNKSGEVAHGRQTMAWLQQNWFNDAAYVKENGRPVLLVFGPQYYNRAQWEQLTTGLPSHPLLYALPHLTQQAGADGAFGWPPVHNGKNIAPADWQKYLHDLYARSDQGKSVIAAVFPKFHDIYKEAGLHDSLGYLDDQQGRTFEKTLALAYNSKARLIQVATWNDYGEGTIIEPTKEFAYRYLESLQVRRSAELGPAFPYGPGNLRLPVMLYQLRQRHPSNPQMKRQLSHASDLLFASKCGAAKTLLLQLWDSNVDQ